MTPTAAPAAPADLFLDIDAACDRIAPTWPLDRFIAVNPYWGWRSSPIADAASYLGVLAGTSLTMPPSWFRAEWRAGRIDRRHLASAAAAAGDPALAAAALDVLEAAVAPERAPLPRLALVTDLRDRGAGPVPGRTWTDLATHQISQYAASHVDRWQASWAPEAGAGLFASWRSDPSVTHGFAWRHGRTWARTQLARLPETPAAALATMLDDLGVGPAGREAYLTALLSSVNGWAAWFAYQRWQARLVGTDDGAIVELLAIRLAWDWLLAADDTPDGRVDRADPELARWAASWTGVGDVAAALADRQRIDWVLQDAVERTYQDTITAGLPNAVPPAEAAEVQAVFCIDVRSEVFRRALEATSSSVQTRGFAGFFGLPVAYTPAGSDVARPQLPGLLSPSLVVIDQPSVADGNDPAALGTRRRRVLGGRRRWQAFRTEPSSMFTYVESTGLLAGASLVQHSLPHDHAPGPWEHDGLDAAQAASLRRRLALVDEDPPAAAAVGHRVLTAMGLVDDFAPLVLLCGHGSTSANNPHAAGLDCGACGGQTGEVNARALAHLLDAPAVRRELAALGITIPDGTWFVPGLHDTTTDTVTLFDTDLAPASHSDAIERLAVQLAAAGRRARAERAGALGLGGVADDAEALEHHVRVRANDWSQVRPEWGLAGNASFVVAPRWRTRHLDLGGRSFLHDYDHRLDPDRSVLTLVMTAPMVVTNWINLQYHASTVDNARYGSGDKVLHNVVGGHVGVYEGNGGDLRIGLSMQSLHDGHQLRHAPLRLSVYIEAPRDAIDGVIAAHTVVQDLVHHSWLHLLRIEPADGSVERRTPTGWEPCPARQD